MDGGFYSSDAQAGRPAVLVTLGAPEPETAGAVFGWVEAARAALEGAGVDIAPLAPAGAALEWAALAPAGLHDRIVYVAEAGGLEMFALDGQAAAILIDRSGRIMGMRPVHAADDLVALAQAQTREPSRSMATSAPALIIPNLVSRDFCRALIDHFEASPHTEGVMASFADGVAYAKLDESKKRRRDIELTPEAPLYRPVLDILSQRCIPQIKEAFQKDMAFIDRILIARYDDTGGYFRRHRDNATPQTRFREFAISLNLNTDEYEGGELLFPEYDDHGYSPAAGGAIIFSAALLHEAAPVTKGSRYVLLSFFCGAAAAAPMT
jgi:predicted 2-oxoglutarate/Fe(II)-dependent dioxygenase YbiX